MKSPVSLGYVVVVMLLALAAAALSYVMPHPAFNLSALLIGVYALHLVSLRVLMREYAGRARMLGKLGEGGVDGRRVNKRDIRDGLEKERRELERQQAELQKKIQAAEAQYDVLRHMIRDRVGNGSDTPGSVSVAPAMQEGTAASPSTGRRNVTIDPPRIHGRW
jgi:hypothetical protein